MANRSVNYDWYDDVPPFLLYPWLELKIPYVSNPHVSLCSRVMGGFI